MKRGSVGDKDGALGACVPVVCVTVFCLVFLVSSGRIASVCASGECVDVTGAELAEPKSQVMEGRDQTGPGEAKEEEEQRQATPRRQVLG